MKIIQVNDIDDLPTIRSTALLKNTALVERILNDVKHNGDAAVQKYEKQFGGFSGSLKVPQEEIDEAYQKVPKEQLTAIRLAKQRLSKIEQESKKRLKGFNVRVDGIKITKTYRPIQSVGCYVPGGLARYPSTVIMSVVPAKIAGVKRIVVTTPPNPEGYIDPLTLVAAKICGADEVYRIGGAQAIGALAFGTESVDAVDKITGPGGPYVTTAKFLVSHQTSIDMIAGPTELGIIADARSDVEVVAADLISQAEHSRDTFCFVITTSIKFAKKLQTVLKNQSKKVQRHEIVNHSLANNGFIVTCKTLDIAISVANYLAPEHIQVMSQNPESIASQLVSAGLVLVGPYCPSAVSDYLLGSNHVLPTNRFARVRGGLSVSDFMKEMTQVSSTKESLKKISKHLEILTQAENLPNHYEAVRIRL